MLDLHAGILGEFTERASRFGKRLSGTYDGYRMQSLETYRATYRAANEAVGLCRSCTDVVKPGRKYCVEHLAKAKERAQRSAAG